MAATRDDLVDRLRANGVRKKVAQTVAAGTPKAVQGVAKDLRKVAEELEDRAKGGPAKRKAAAKKAAATRKRKAQKRSQAAKKAARTRASRTR
jgi:hypothetical protein